jgi:RNA polymerase sigma-70 factor (ECF subfamily)
MTLRTDQRAVVVLRHFLGCSYHDLSDILGVPEKTVKSRLFSARQLLKDALQSRGMGR